MLLVTGGAGYIGSHFIKAYLNKFTTHELLIIDNFSQGHHEAIANLSNVKIVNCDLMNLTDLEKVFETYPVDAVIHFAAYTEVGESQINPVKFFQNNVSGSINLVNAMDNFGVKKMVFSSSCAVYGIPEKIPIAETTPVNPLNIYGLTKKIIEDVLLAMHKTKGLSCVILRYFNASGASFDGSIGEAHDPESHLIPLVLNAALTNKPLKIFGGDYPTHDGTCIRDYIHVNDLANAHLKSLALVETSCLSEVFNLGSSCGVSVLDIIKTASMITNTDIAYEIVARRDGDPPVLIADYEKAKQGLNFYPEYDLTKIIQSAWRWQLNKQY